MLRVERANRQLLSLRAARVRARAGELGLLRAGKLVLPRGDKLVLLRAGKLVLLRVGKLVLLRAGKLVLLRAAPARTLKPAGEIKQAAQGTRTRAVVRRVSHLTV